MPAPRVADRIESPIPEEEAERLRQEAMQLEPELRVQWVVPEDPRTPLAQRTAPVAAAASFDSLDISDCCGGSANVPPDPELAAGPSHLIAVVNVALEIYDKSGTVLLGPLQLSDFLGADETCKGLFDPNVLYDEAADRFLVAADAEGVRYCIAASQTSDPTGAWWVYSFDTGSASNFFDYPHAGVGVDAIYMGANIFRGSFLEGRVWAFDKAAMYIGNVASAVTHSTSRSHSTPQPMNLHGFGTGTWPATGPHYIMTELFDGANHTVWAWDDPFGADSFGQVGTLDLEAATGVTAGLPIDAPQLGGAAIQANDWRGLDTEYRNGRIWMTNSLASNPGEGTVNCVRWAEIDPTLPSVIQAGVFGSNGDHRLFPDLAVDACENMAVGYTKTATDRWPSVWATGREFADTPGTVSGSETELKAGEITYTAFDSVPRRWGDYTGMTIDPDGKTFWYLGEYSKDTDNFFGRWGTWVGSLTVPGCEPCAQLLLDSGETVTDTRLEEACAILAGPYVVGPTGDVTFRSPRIGLRGGFVAAGDFTAENP